MVRILGEEPAHTLASVKGQIRSFITQAESMLRLGVVAEVNDDLPKLDERKVLEQSIEALNAYLQSETSDDHGIVYKAFRAAYVVGALTWTTQTNINLIRSFPPDALNPQQTALKTRRRAVLRNWLPIDMSTIPSKQKNALLQRLKKEAGHDVDLRTLTDDLKSMGIASDRARTHKA